MMQVRVVCTAGFSSKHGFALFLRRSKCRILFFGGMSAATALSAQARLFASLSGYWDIWRYICGDSFSAFFVVHRVKIDCF
jgi:hypothetical protein